MSYGLSLVARKLLLPSVALVLGAMAYTPGTLVADGTCQRFEGGLSGNDPDAETQLVMCRCGDRLYGRLSVEGQAGLSVGEIVGEVRDDNRAVFVDVRPIVSQPNDGWMFCFDDVYELTWDPFSEKLSGTYRSEQCDDSGTMVLLRR